MKKILKKLGFVTIEDLAAILKPVAEPLPFPNCVFGFHENPKKIHGKPEGTCKLVMETGKPVQLVCLGEKSDAAFLLEERGDFWILAKEIKREVIV
jgi:hypothetical protein